MTKEEIEEIKSYFEKLHNDYDFEELDNEIELGDETINIPFPRDTEIEFEPEYLLKYLREYDSIKIHNLNKVTTDTITQRVISISDYSKYIHFDFFEMSFEGDITLTITSEPFLIGLGATKTDNWDKYYPPCSSHIAIEIQYPNKESRISEEDEERLIKSFFFEISNSYKVSFEFSTFEYIEYYNFEEVEEKSKDLPKSFEEFNIGMDLFIKANQSLSSDLKYLSYYKIFEYFGPFHSRIEAFEAMRKKLDSSSANNPSAEFISSIFDLTKNYEKNIRDKELIKSLIDNTFDLVDIYKSIPLSIRKNMNLEVLEYKTKKEVKDRIINHLGNVLYNTRNAIVHAKSNYDPTGLECKDEELGELNDFMHMAAYSTIKWYNRLPKHLKIT
jgi:hypothetical protein